MNCIYYSLKHKEDKDVELKCWIDLDTIDDDEPTSEYLQNDGSWDTALPHYWKTEEINQIHLLQDLKEIEVMEWDWIAQALVDCGAVLIEDDVYIRDFENARLYISYAEDFSSKIATSYPLGRVIDNDYNE